MRGDSRRFWMPSIECPRKKEVKQLAKEHWKEDERHRIEIEEMGKLVEMHRRYHIEKEETRSAVEKLPSSRETA